MPTFYSRNWAGIRRHLVYRDVHVHQSKVCVFKAICASATLPPHLGKLEPVVFLKVLILEII